MMSYETFKQWFTDRLTMELDGRYKVRPSVVTSSKGKYEGVSISRKVPGVNWCTDAGPVIPYLDAYEKYSEGEDTLYKFVKCIVEEDMNTNDTLEKFKEKGKLYISIFNGGVELASNSIVKDFYDMKVCLAFRYTGSDINAITYSVRSMVGDVNISDDELWSMAASNSFSMDNVSLVRMVEMIKQTNPNSDLPDNDNMFILTNKDLCQGASMIYSNDVLRWVYNTIGGNYLIMPSSIHECVLLKCDDSSDKDLFRFCKKMLVDINRSCVSPTEFLSDTLFLYDGVNGLSVVDEEE